MTHAPGGAWVCPRIGVAQAPGGAQVCHSARCPLPMACNPTKTCADHFLPPIPSMPNAPQQKDNHNPPPLPLQFFVSRARL